jgi:pimeloyl-ACP methyl ester carboxylesterase
LAVFWQLTNEKNGKHIFHNLMTYMRDRKEHRERWVSVLQQLTIPLALINGAVDPVSGAHMVARCKDLNCRLGYLGVLANIGHYPQMEDSDGVVRHYLDFMEAIKNTSK